MGFVSKSLVSREREITACQSSANYSPVTQWASSVVSAEAEGAQAEQPRHTRVLALVGLASTFCFLSCSWPVTSQCFAFVLPKSSLRVLGEFYNFLDRLRGKAVVVPPPGNGAGPLVTSHVTMPDNSDAELSLSGRWWRRMKTLTELSVTRRQGAFAVFVTSVPHPDPVLPFQGFSVEGQENLQEILSKQLLLCQFLMALSVVRTGDTELFPTPGPVRGPPCWIRACRKGWLGC